MATVEEVLAKASEWEAAGNSANAEKLRAYAKTLAPTPPTRDAASVASKADEWDAAGQPEKAAKLRAYAATLTPVEAPVDAPVDAPASSVPDQPAPPPRAKSENEIGHDSATEFAGFEMFNPELKGRYTPETMPKAGDTVMGQGGGGKSGGARLTVRDWHRKPKEQFGDTAKAMMAGPMDAAKSYAAGLTDVSKSPSYAFLSKDPLTSNLPNAVNATLSKFGDGAMAALSTLGVGFSGGAGIVAEGMPGQDAASRLKLGEELGGMSQFIVPELVGMSSIASRVATGAKAVPKAVEATRKIAIEKPSVETLRTAKTAAYKAVDDAGEVFSADEMASLRDKVTADLDAGNYVSGVDKQTDAVLSLLDRKSGEPMTLGQLDKLRQEFYKRLSVAPNEIGIEDAIDGIDDMIASNTASSELMQSARAANAKYKKVETLDLAFQKARDQTAAAGSGGNILNKYRQAVSLIVNNPKKAKWFSADEVATMRGFIEGSKGENVARLIGKISPGGNGLMLALNLLASGATGGASLVATGIGIGAKALADSGATKGTTRLMNKVAGETPAPKAARKPANGDIIVGPIRDAAAPIGQAAATEAANTNRNPDYEALRGRY